MRTTLYQPALIRTHALFLDHFCEAREALSERGEQLGAEVQQVEQQLATARQEADALGQQRTALEEEVSALSERGEQLGAEVQQAEQQLATARQQAEGVAQERTALEQEISALSTHRDQLRTETAQAEQQLATTRQEAKTLGQQRLGVEEEIAGLSARREQLGAEVQEAEQQRANLQQQATQLAQALAESSAELLAIEERVQQLQDQSAPQGEIGAASAGGARPDASVIGTAPGPQDPAAAARAATSNIEASAQEAQSEAKMAPGQYSSGAVHATFEPGGHFIMSAANGARSVEGQYAFENGLLILSNVRGDIGLTELPIRCGIEATDGGFSLQEHQNSCRELAGMTFRPQR